MFSRLNSSSSRQIVCSSVRTLSSKAPTVSHEPPKKIHGIVGRYASALYTSASKVSSYDFKITLVMLSCCCSTDISSSSNSKSSGTTLCLYAVHYTVAADTIAAYLY